MTENKTIIFSETGNPYVSCSTFGTHLTLHCSPDSRVSAGHSEFPLMNKLIRLQTSCLVIGGGPAGYGAALAAGRRGVSTIIVERHGYLGGMGTSAGLTCYLNTIGANTDISDSIYRELVGQMRQQKLCYHSDHAQADYFDPESNKLLMEQNLIKQGVQILYHTLFSGIDHADDGTWLVECIAKNARIKIKADFVVDCTGDADVCAAAGAETIHGRNNDGRAQPMSMVVQLSGFDPHEWAQAGGDLIDGRFALACDSFSDQIEKARGAGTWSIPRENIAMLWSSPADPTRITINGTRINGLSACNPLDVTRAEIEGRRQAQEILHFFRNYIPGFSKAQLLETGPQIGVRESRRIVGRSTLTEEDIRQNILPKDMVVRCSYPIDIHSPDSDQTQFEATTRDHAYGIGWASMLPRNLENIAAAGRCISATHEAAGSFRIMSTCMGLGEAAGTGVTLALRKKVNLEEVSGNEIRLTMDESLKPFLSSKKFS